MKASASTLSLLLDLVYKAMPRRRRPPGESMADDSPRGTEDQCAGVQEGPLSDHAAGRAPQRRGSTALLVPEQANPPADGSSSDLLVQEALRQIGQKKWGRAQQALERAVGSGDCEAVRGYLADVRAVRRCLRQIGKWPRDPGLHLELGRLYFSLELGDDAQREWQCAVELDPGFAEGYYYLALEYLYREDEEKARQTCQRAHDLNPSLPTFDELQRKAAGEVA